ncbi:MAG: putative HNHc nuclease [Nitrospinales bacterium]
MDKSLKYLDYIRSLPCAYCGQPAEPHHLKAVGMGRNRKRPMKEHLTTIPVCRQHHNEAHAGLLVGPWKVAMLLLVNWIWND